MSKGYVALILLLLAGIASGDGDICNPLRDCDRTAETGNTDPRFNCCDDPPLTTFSDLQVGHRMHLMTYLNVLGKGSFGGDLSALCPEASRVLTRRSDLANGINRCVLPRGKGVRIHRVCVGRPHAPTHGTRCTLEPSIRIGSEGNIGTIYRYDQHRVKTTLGNCIDLSPVQTVQAFQLAVDRHPSCTDIDSNYVELDLEVVSR